MARPMSDKTKQKLGLGSGVGKDYRPYINTSEFNSLGTTSVIKDWKTGRDVHCLSQGEAYWYYILRWDDNNIDIREQFPLDNKVTNKIANECGIKHPKSPDHIMTIDFMVTEQSGTLHAYSIKPSRESIGERCLEILYIEKVYCSLLGIKFDLLFKTDANTKLANNIRLVTEFYDSKNVFDWYSEVKHKIAIKEIAIDMEQKILTNEILEQAMKGCEF